MLRYIIRCFEYSALGCSVMCIWDMVSSYGYCFNAYRG